MTNNEAIAVLESEAECARKRFNGECDCECKNCRLLPSYYIVASAYSKAIKMLDVDNLKEQIAERKLEKGVSETERLTIKCRLPPKGQFMEISKSDLNQVNASTSEDIYRKLQAYEDTGVTPEGVEMLKASVNHTHQKLTEIQDLLCKYQSRKD